MPDMTNIFHKRKNNATFDFYIAVLTTIENQNQKQAPLLVHPGSIKLRDFN